MNESHGNEERMKSGVCGLGSLNERKKEEVKWELDC